MAGLRSDRASSQATPQAWGRLLRLSPSSGGGLVLTRRYQKVRVHEIVVCLTSSGWSPCHFRSHPLVQGRTERLDSVCSHQSLLVFMSFALGKFSVCVPDRRHSCSLIHLTVRLNASQTVQDNCSRGDEVLLTTSGPPRVVLVMTGLELQHAAPNPRRGL